MATENAVRPRLMFVHAHPDDESSKGAASAAKYVDEGAEVVLVTATDGAAGEILNPHHPAVEADQLGEVRARELAAAIHTIGFSHVHMLGWPDSGLPDDPSDVAPGCFAAIDLDVAAESIATLLRTDRPHVVVTYPPDGGYPHPDHIRVHDATMRALELARAPGPGGEAWDVPRTVFLTGFPRVRLEALHEALEAAGIESHFGPWLERREARDADRTADIVVDVADWWGRRDDALRAHATQVDPGGQWFAVPRDIEREVWPWDTYVVLDGQPAPPGATDLFAGLDLEP